MPMDKMNLADLIGSRRSVRWYTSAPVPEQLVDDLLKCAIRAPSAHNRQPWRFVVLVDSEVKSQLASAMAHRLMKDRQRDGDASESIETDARRSVCRLVKAPVVIVALMTMRDMDRYSDPRREAAEQMLAVQGTAMAVQNVLLAAHEVGLGACIMCAPAFCPEEVREALGLPGDWIAQCAITLGWPDESRLSAPRDRGPLNQIVTRICRIGSRQFSEDVQ